MKSLVALTPPSLTHTHTHTHTQEKWLEIFYFARTSSLVVGSDPFPTYISCTYSTYYIYLIEEKALNYKKKQIFQTLVMIRCHHEYIKSRVTSVGSRIADVYIHMYVCNY